MLSHLLGPICRNLVSGATITSVEREIQRVWAVTEEEKAAIEADDISRYLALLAGDAVFMPPGSASKSGDELRAWLAEFLSRVAIHYSEFIHGETLVRDDLAYHAYTCSWTAAPKSGGPPATMWFKGVHILRRQTSGEWKIWRSIWNADPPRNPS